MLMTLEIKRKRIIKYRLRRREKIGGKKGERYSGQTPKRQRADINLHDSSENNNECPEILFKDCNINLMEKISNTIPREFFN